MNLLLHGSLVVVFLWLVVGGLGIPIPEDIAVIATGVLVHRDVIPLWLAVLVLFAGVLIGDALLFFLARRLGPKAYDRPLIARLLPLERREKIDAAYHRYGGRLVFLARHVAGLRGAVFAMAGISGMAPRRFLLWDALAACVSIPLTLALGYFGSAHFDHVRAGVDRVEHWLLLGLAVAGIAYLAWRHRHELLARVRPTPAFRSM